MLLTAYLEMLHGSILLNCWLRGCKHKVCSARVEAPTCNLSNVSSQRNNYINKHTVMKQRKGLQTQRQSELIHDGLHYFQKQQRYEP